MSRVRSLARGAWRRLSATTGDTGDLFTVICLSIPAALLISFIFSSCEPSRVEGAVVPPPAVERAYAPPVASGGVLVRPAVLVVAEAVQAAFPPEQWSAAMEVAACETGGTFDWSVRVIDTNGAVSAGAWQVQPQWWGDVPADPHGQAQQVAGIVREWGWRWWSCRPNN